MCAPGHAEWGVGPLLKQVVGLTNTKQTAVCDESCRVGGPGWGRDRARGQRGLVTVGGIWSCSIGDNDSIPKQSNRALHSSPDTCPTDRFVPVCQYSTGKL